MFLAICLKPIVLADSLSQEALPGVSIEGQLYKLGIDGIIRRCVLTHERQGILWECHSGVAGGHYGGKAITQKVL